MGIAPPVHVLKQWALWQDPSNGPFGFFRRGPDSDMALDSHGFVWHLLTFYISNLTSEASLWHSMLCPFHGERGSRPTSYIFLHLLTTENHLPTGTFMNFDELSSFCQPHLKTTLRYSAKSVRLGGNDLIQIGPVRWLHQELNATGHAGQLSASVIAFFGPLDSFAEALTQTWLLTHTDLFDICWHFTSEASLWHSMLCPFTASVARGLLLTSSYWKSSSNWDFHELWRTFIILSTSSENDIALLGKVS